MSAPAEDGRRQRVRLRLRAAGLSVVVGVGLLLAKLLAYHWTGSAAILSDALESIINVVASTLAFWAILQASKPADRDHPYGHGKAEDFSAGVEGALIVLAAGFILWFAVPLIFDPPPVRRLGAGLAIVVAAGAINGLVGLYLVREGRRQESRALVADGKHLLADAVTSAGVIIGLLLVRVTGRAWLDPLAACAIAIHILGSGYHIIRESVGRLMDEADEALLERVADVLRRGRQASSIDVHQLRAWRSGDRIHLDFHLTLPRYWSIEQAHATEKQIEAALVADLGGELELMVHRDPCKPICCSLCAVDPCPVREAQCVAQPEWTAERLVEPPSYTE